MVTTSDRPPENITVILHFGVGSFEQGFPIRAEIFEGQKKITEKDNFRTPPCPDIPNLYWNWQKYYAALGKTMKLNNQSKEPTASEETETTPGVRRAIQVPSAQVTNHSTLGACQSAAQALQYELQKSSWFSSPSFENLQHWILMQTAVHLDSSVPVMFDFRTGSDEHNNILKKLPWHLWDLFNKLKNAEPVLLGKFEKSVTSAFLTSPVKILAIFGSNEGEPQTEGGEGEAQPKNDEGKLQLGDDKAALLELQESGAEIKVLREPEREVLHKYLSQSHWDILFFAGHSYSDDELKDGYLLVGKGRSYSIDNLREDLKIAVNNGLKMAMFNSCDGLGIAEFLMNLNVPTVLVFREPVPDLVARKFLQTFLQKFLPSSSQEKPFPLYKAVRAARNESHWLDSNDKEICPCADWLPIIYQKPSYPELVFTKKTTEKSPFTSWRRYSALAVVPIALITGVVLWSRLPQPVVNPKPVSIDSSTHSGTDVPTSSGERLIIQSHSSPDKQQGILAFKQNNFDEAIVAFKRSLKANPNDPETLIYLNNAIAEQSVAAGLHSKLQLAVTVPSFNGNQSLAEEILRGVAQAQSELNCGVDVISKAIEQPESPVICNGNGGKLLAVTIADETVTKDPQKDAEATTKIATVFAKNPDILGVIGHFSSSMSRQAQAIYDQNKLVAISPTSTSVDLSDSSDYFFRTTPSDAIAAQDLVNYARNTLNLNQDQIAVASVPNDEYSQSLRGKFLSAFSSKQYAYDCDLSQGGDFFDAQQCVRNSLSQNAKALLLVPTTEEYLVKALELANNDGELTLLGGDAMYNPKTLSAISSQAVKTGLVIAIPWSRGDNSSQFEKDAKQLYKTSSMNWRSAMAYDATQAIAEGLKLQGDNPTRSGLQSKLASDSFTAKGVLGSNTVKFDDSGDRNLAGLENKIGVLVKVERKQQGEGYEFVPLP